MNRYEHGEYRYSGNPIQRSSIQRYPRYNDKYAMSRKSYSKMYGTEPRYNDLRYNDEFLAHRA